MSRDALAQARELLGPLATPDAPLGARTTYRVGGRAALLVVADGPDALIAVRDAVASTAVPVLVLGKGSNMLVSEAGFPGVAVVLGPAFASIELDAERRVVKAGGAAPLPLVARTTAAAGWGGMEWAVGVPGSVGGGVRMNAGGHGAAIVDRLERWWCVDLRGGADGERSVGDLNAGYRNTAVGDACVVTAAEFRLDHVDRVVAEARIDEIVRWRRANQPGGQNAGSVFTNPSDDSAGRLVEAAGCKGLRVGSAQVSRKHANFIQADPDGRADDVLALIAEVRRRVTSTSGVELTTEVRLIGFSDTPW